MNHLRQFVGALLGGAALMATGACSFGSADPEPSNSSLQQIDEVGGRERVPTIRLLTYPAAIDPTRFELSRMIVDSWTAAGIDAELLPVNDARLTSLAWESKEYDVYAVGYGPSLDRLDPDNMLTRFRSANATPDGTNVSMYQSEAFDEAYLRQSQAVDEETRSEAVHEAQVLIYEDLPVAPIFHPVVGAAYRSDRWEGIEPSLGNSLYNVWNATHATPLDDRNQLVVGTINDPPTLNPVVADSAESQLPLSLIYDTLLGIGPDGEAFERAAEEVEAQPDRVAVTLRPGMTFSDGRPVRAEDVAFSIEYLRDNGAPLYSAALENVEKVTASGDTVDIQLKKPAASFVDVSLTQMPILPEHVWSGVDGSKFTNAEPIGSGPFELTDRQVGASLSYAARPEHYAPPVVDSLELVILGSFEAGIGGIESGEIDLFDDQQPAQQYARLQDVDGVTVVETQSHGWQGLHYNTSKAPFDDLAFRRALTALIPTEEIIEVVMRGEAQPAGSIIAPVLEPWHDPSLESLAYDPEAAAESLSEAGYAVDSDGTLYYPEGHDAADSGS